MSFPTPSLQHHLGVPQSGPILTLPTWVSVIWSQDSIGLRAPVHKTTLSWDASCKCQLTSLLSSLATKSGILKLASPPFDNLLEELTDLRKVHYSLLFPLTAFPLLVCTSVTKLNRISESRHLYLIFDPRKKVLRNSPWRMMFVLSFCTSCQI